MTMVQNCHAAPHLASNNVMLSRAFPFTRYLNTTTHNYAYSLGAGLYSPWSSTPDGYDETSPATEPFERTLQRFSNANITYYLILEKQDIIGAIRVRKQDTVTYVLVQIFILPEFQNKGYAQQAIEKVESLYPEAEHWRLDTIKQEEKLCYLYSKMGYQRTGEIEHIKEGMDIVFFEKGGI